MKKRLLLTIALLGFSGTALGAAYTISDHANKLKTDYGHSYELAIQDIEENLPEAVEVFKQQEMKRMESETRAYLDNKLKEKEASMTEEKRQAITYETNGQIEELKKFIDKLFHE